MQLLYYTQAHLLFSFRRAEYLQVYPVYIMIVQRIFLHFSRCISRDAKLLISERRTRQYPIVSQFL